MLSAKKVEVELNIRMKRAQKGKEKAEGGKTTHSGSRACSGDAGQGKTNYGTLERMISGKGN